jgi:hypothetical protein
MDVVVGIFFGMAMLVALVGAVFTNVKLWGLIRESRKSFRQLPAEKR